MSALSPFAKLSYKHYLPNSFMVRIELVNSPKSLSESFFLVLIFIAIIIIIVALSSWLSVLLFLEQPLL